MSARLQVLQSEFDKVRSGLDEIENKAVAESRDLTDSEQTDTDALYARAESLKGEIEPLAERQRSISATADVLNRLNLSRPTPSTHGHGQKTSVETHLPSAGEYVTAFIRSCNAEDHDGQDVFRSMTEHMRTVQDTIVSDVAGIVPIPIIGELIAFVDDQRPVCNSMSQRPMPSAGKTFLRPRLTQRTNVAEQMNELDEVASRTFKIANEAVTKRTFAGVIDLSAQSTDWTDPSLVALVLQDFIGEYALDTETAMAAAFAAAVTNTSGFGTGSVSEVLESFADAAVYVYAKSKRWPNTLWLSLDVWAELVAVTNTYEQPVFPALGSGQIVLTGNFNGNPLGLNVVVGPTFPEDTMIVGHNSLCEFYEQKRGLLRVDKPSVLGVEIATFGYVAQYVRPEGFVNMGAGTD